MNLPVRSASVLLAVLLAGGCAAWRTPPAREKPGAAVSPPPATPHPATVPPPPAVLSAGDNSYHEGLAMMKEGRFERALELFAEAWQAIPGHRGVETNFPAALEGARKSGDHALMQGRAREAGKRWAAALKFLSHPAMKGKRPPFSKGGLKEDADRLTDDLLEKGLVAYQEGRLEEAIATWRDILAYDPANEEANKYVKTATTQLETLKKLTAPPPAK